MKLKTLLETGATLLADGAMGTTLFALGLQHGDPPEMWLRDHPERIQDVHRGYIEAGSNIILTNSFGGNRLRLALHNMSAEVADLNRRAAEAAQQAAQAAETVVVAGSMGPTGGLLEPLGELTHEQIVDIYAEQAGALARGGVDVFWIETMSDLGELRAAVEGARQADADTPIAATMTFDTAGHTMMGVSPEKAMEAMLALDLVALGANCGNGVEEIETVIEKMHAVAPDVVLIAKANAGIPHLEGGVPVYGATPEIMAAYATRVRSLGARIIGGCCGSTAAHMAAMSQALQAEAGS